jgi:hypothetical protein
LVPVLLANGTKSSYAGPMMDPVEQAASALAQNPRAEQLARALSPAPRKTHGPG